MSSVKKDIKTKVISGLFWKFSERMGAQLVNFVVAIVLARLLLPEDYGLIALITIFIAISNVFVKSGMGSALIQKKDADELDFSTVFYFSIVMSILLYGILFLIAPYIANFYREPQLTPVIRVFSLSLLIAGVNTVQQAYVSKTMQFKRFFFSTLFGTLTSAVVGIVMAYQGYGVWALVVQQLFNATVDMLVLWFTVKWRPKLMFSWKRLKGLYSFGWKLLASSLLDTLYNEMRNLVIGKKYSSSMLAYYNRGNQFPALIVSNINDSIQSVMLPVLSEKREHPEIVKSMVRRSIETSSFFIFPMMVGLACAGNTIVSLLLTDKWLPCVIFLQLSCFIYAFYPIHTANLQAITAMGRSDIFLKLEIVKKVLGVLILCVSIFCFESIIAIALGGCVTTIVSSFINAYPNKKLLNYSYFEQIKDILPSAFLALLMGVCVFAVGKLEIGNHIVVLLTQVLLGICIYFGLAFWMHLECLSYLTDIFKKRKKNQSND